MNRKVIAILVMVAFLCVALGATVAFADAKSDQCKKLDKNVKKFTKMYKKAKDAYDKACGGGGVDFICKGLKDKVKKADKKLQKYMKEYEKNCGEEK